MNKYDGLDIYLIGDVYKVFKRGEVPLFGEPPEAEPLCCSGDFDECWNWCDEHCASNRQDDDGIRYYECAGIYEQSYADDVLRKAIELFDKYQEEGRANGWGDLVIDHTHGDRTYRRSAAWKDEPFYYTFDQPLKWTSKPDGLPESSRELWTRDRLVGLCGMADALDELGMMLVFTKDLSLHLFGRREAWIRKSV